MRADLQRRLDALEQRAGAVDELLLVRIRSFPTGECGPLVACVGMGCLCVRAAGESADAFVLRARQIAPRGTAVITFIGGPMGERIARDGVAPQAPRPLPIDSAPRLGGSISSQTATACAICGQVDFCSPSCSTMRPGLSRWAS